MGNIDPQKPHPRSLFESFIRYTRAEAFHAVGVLVGGLSGGRILNVSKTSPIGHPNWRVLNRNSLDQPGVPLDLEAPVCARDLPAQAH